jgi:hypothetical protein
VQAATPHVTPVPPTAPPGDRPSRSWTPPLVAALGAVTTIVGLGFGYAAWHKTDRYCDENGACDPQQLERAHDLARTSNFVTAAGAAVLAGGCIWWAIDRSRTVTTSAALSPGAAFVLTRVAF